MPKLIENEIRPEYCSSSGTNSYDIFNSGARKVMYAASHLGQALVLDSPTLKRSFSGMEREFGRFTFNVKFPEGEGNVRIVASIPKYENTVNQHFPHNPTTIIIYEDTERREFGIVEAVYHSQSIDNKHQHFGYKYEYSERRFTEGQFVPKGTVIADSPSKTPDGDYRYGTEANIAFMGFPGVIEDGVIVSESFCKRLKTYGYEKRVINWGREAFPLNLYPEKGRYKIFPDIGEEIRQDGLLMALRPWDYLLGPLDLAPQALAEPDYNFDRLTFTPPGMRGMEHLPKETIEQMRDNGLRMGSAKVVDINVWYNDAVRTPFTPLPMVEQPRAYLNNLKRFHRRILEEYNNLYKAYKEGLSLTPEFHRQVVESMSFFKFTENPVTERYAHRNPDLKSRNVHKTYRDQKIDEWLVEISFCYEVIPTKGAKLTDLNGNRF